MRKATVDTRLGTTPISAGDQVVASIIDANLDVSNFTIECMICADLVFHLRRKRLRLIPRRLPLIALQSILMVLWEWDHTGEPPTSMSIIYSC